MLTNYEMLNLGPILNFPDFQKGTLCTTFSVKNRLLVFLLSSGRRPKADPVFHGAMVINVPLGLKTSFL